MEAEDYPVYADYSEEIFDSEGATEWPEETTTATSDDATFEYEDYPSDNETDQGPFDGAEQRVVGGKSAWNGQFPHQVSLQDESRGHFCGASIIQPLLLLTAAHCLTSPIVPTRFQAVTGAHNLKDLNQSVQVRDVTRVIIHEKWNKTTKWDNDIALLVLNESLVFDDFTKPVDIWERGAEGKKGAYVSGWGKTENGTISDVLQYAMISFRSRSACQRTYANLREKLVITDNMLCAGGKDRDTCNGDSGGALSCLKWNVKTNPNDVYQCGIVSFGVGCKTGRPGIYTDVSKYYGWIKKHMHALSQQNYVTSLGKSLEADQCDEGVFDCQNYKPVQPSG